MDLVPFTQIMSNKQDYSTSRRAYIPINSCSLIVYALINSDQLYLGNGDRAGRLQQGEEAMAAPPPLHACCC